MKTKTVSEFQVINHGVENSQYFQGCGVAFTAYTDVATGIGSSAAEALADALESLAQADWDVSAVESAMLADLGPDADKDDVPEDSEECYHYVSVRVRGHAHSETSCPLSVAKAIDTLRNELLAHYGADFAFVVSGRGHVLSAATLDHGDLRPLPYSPEEQADEREAEIDRANPLD